MNFTIPTFQVKIETPIAVIRPVEEPKPQPIKYTVQPNDTLNSIATTYNTTVQRIFNKNTTIENPDVIKPSDELIIPLNDEVLTERVMPSTITPLYNPVPTSAPSGRFSGSELLGSIGYAIHTGNCVNTARAFGKIQPGNPISWVPSTQQPFIGAAALFSYNHVGIVVGIWSNGDLEIAHENYRGVEHRFPRSSFRGFF